jgi:hypothetical protein
MKKTEGRKFRDTVPLRTTFCNFFLLFQTYSIHYFLFTRIFYARSRKDRPLRCQILSYLYHYGQDGWGYAVQTRGFSHITRGSGTTLNIKPSIKALYYSLKESLHRTSRIILIKGIVLWYFDGIFMILSYSLAVRQVPHHIIFFLILCFHI